MMKSKMVHGLIAYLILMVGNLSSVQAVTDAELEALEKQIEQQEAEEERKAEEELEKQRLLEEKRLAEKQAEEKRKQEAEKKRLAEIEQQQLKEEEIKKIEEENQQKYDQIIAEAKQAMDKNNYELAKNHYHRALKIYNNDEIALAGINHIQELENICLSIIGEWGWDNTSQTMTFEPDGVVVHRAALNTVVKENWKCADPENHKFFIIGRSGEYIEYFLSKDENKLKGIDPWGNISFAKRNTENMIKNTLNKNGAVANVDKNNFCSELIGIWQWNNGSKSWFFENGTVKTKAIIIKSEGNWECVDPENRIFTFNTWNKKREIKMKEDFKQLQSVGLLGEKIIANKISDNPFEKNVPVQKSSPSIIGQ